MKFQTMSLIAGNHICNASCPFCVSRMTKGNDIDLPVDAINVRNLKKAISIAERCDITSVLITGKGEPTLYPQHIDEYMRVLSEQSEFPFIELQSNGFLFECDSFKDQSVDDMIKRWYDQGLTTVMLSNVGHDKHLNHKTYFPRRDRFFDIAKVVDRIHEHGLIVRYTTVGIKGGIDNAAEMDKLVAFCRSMGIEQLTWRPVAQTADSTTMNKGVNAWVTAKGLTDEQSEATMATVKQEGTLLYNLVHGAAVYDYKGQNVCLSTCLTHDPDEETIRQLIFYPDGKLFTDWQYTGSRLL